MDDGRTLTHFVDGRLQSQQLCHVVSLNVVFRHRSAYVALVILSKVNANACTCILASIVDAGSIGEDFGISHVRFIMFGLLFDLIFLKFVSVLHLKLDGFHIKHLFSLKMVGPLLALVRYDLFCIIVVIEMKMDCIIAY